MKCDKFYAKAKGQVSYGSTFVVLVHQAGNKADLLFSHQLDGSTIIELRAFTRK
jgi:hypothetical protein